MIDYKKVILLWNDTPLQFIDNDISYLRSITLYWHIRIYQNTLKSNKKDATSNSNSQILILTFILTIISNAFPEV